MRFTFERESCWMLAVLLIPLLGVLLAIVIPGGSQYTAKHQSWQLVASVEFTNEHSAVLFEQYLKTGSGRAFAKRCFI
jgi:hypothetical protein